MAEVGRAGDDGLPCQWSVPVRRALRLGDADAAGRSFGPSNIAEGAARKGHKEYLRFLYMARASLSELDTQMEIAGRLQFIGNVEAGELQSGIDEVSRMLNSMIRSIARAAGSDV